MLLPAAERSKPLLYHTLIMIISCLLVIQSNISTTHLLADTLPYDINDRNDISPGVHTLWSFKVFMS